MGTSDFECAVCRDPIEFDCAEDDDDEDADVECEESGYGADEAHLRLFFFKGDAPKDLAAFRARYREAARVETLKARYDWGAWEFEPSLNYRAVLRGDTRNTSNAVWRIEELGRDDHPIEVERGADETVWVVNCCPTCHSSFLASAGGADPLCRAYLAHVAENHDLDADDEVDKDRLEESIRRHLKSLGYLR